jgi:signal transduction histidine kinase
MERSSVKERISNWWPLRRGKGRLTREAGAALFQGLRVRLTLWYCGVLGAALVLFSVILYFGAQYFLINPIETDAEQHAGAHVIQVQTGDPDACLTYAPFNQGPFGPPPQNQGPFNTELVACYQSDGSLAPADISEESELPSVFFTNGLAKLALQTGHPQSDIVDAGGSTGQIYRYAEPIPSTRGSGYVGVVVIGESVRDAESALGTLLKLLLALGGAALLGAGVGGLFLSKRALAPARLAWANQQRFIGDAAHELRTPLTLLRADAEVLLRSRKGMDAEDAGLLEDIVAEANHMSTLATNMLTLARLDSGAQHQEHEVVSLSELAQVGVRRVRAFAEEHEITVEAEDSGDPYVIGDPMLLEQAMLVLLDNAIKYNQKGGRVVIRTAAEDGKAIMRVSDSGIGIAAEHLPHLGERFYRVDKARSREAGGTGLGLSIARSIATAHGGSLTLSSVAGQGTTVTMTLPIADVVVSDLDEETPGSMSSLSERIP